LPERALLVTDLEDKKTAFFYNDNVWTKKQFFEAFALRRLAGTAVQFTASEKERTGYDVAIVLWSKRTISDTYRKRLLRKLVPIHQRV
jgi:hypothetical protein